MSNGEEEQDWRMGQKSLGEQLWHMYLHEMQTDVTVCLVNEQKQKAYKCHKIILMRLSPVFENLIKTCEDDEDHDCCVSVTNIQPNLFDLILRFAYTDHLEFSSLQNAIEIKEFSKRYNIQLLVERCSTFVANAPVDADTVWDVLDNLHRGVKLSAKVKKFLAKQTLACLESSRFLSCSQSSLLLVLSMEQLNVSSELPLVEAAVRWAGAHNLGSPLDPTTSKRLLGPCLQQLRFLALSAAEFSAHVAAAGLFSPEEALQILVNLTTPDHMQLPEHVSRISTPRTTSQPDVKKEPEVLPKEKEKKKNGEQKGQQVVCFRGTYPAMDNFNTEVTVPAVFDFEFSVNKDVKISGIRLVAQVNKSDSVDDSYVETIHVGLKKEGCSKQVAFHTFISSVKYGPGSVFDVNFSKPGQLKAGQKYVLKLNMKSSGVYICHVRGSTVYVEELVVNFSSHEKCPHSGLLHSLIFQV